MSLTLADDILRKIQAGSGLAFTAFLTAHLSGHFLACLDFQLAESALVAVRKIAQDPTVEVTIVFGSVFVHLSASVGRVIIRTLKKKRGTVSMRKDGQIEQDKLVKESMESAPPKGKAVSKGLLEMKLHRLTGYMLAGLYFWHVADTRIKSVMAFSDANVLDLTYITWSIQQIPLKTTLAYLLLGSTSIYHGIYGASSALKTFNVRPSFPNLFVKKGDPTDQEPPKSRWEAVKSSSYVRIGVVGVGVVGLTIASIAAGRYGGIRGALKWILGDDGGVAVPWPQVPKEKLWREMNEVFGGLVMGEIQ
ncbi:hypothetical protein HDU67_008738 [Dinochytrium kinnereticum]|nr:hypothetical protein HDU67_008738 [Dinochytrium kinnereticum]